MMNIRLGVWIRNPNNGQTKTAARDHPGSAERGAT